MAPPAYGKKRSRYSCATQKPSMAVPGSSCWTAHHKAEELASINSLSSLSSVRATDTAADWPAMFASLLKWSLDAKPGSLEVWVATDLQKSNWRPTDSVWRTVEAQFAGAGLQVRFRLLELSHSGKGEQSRARKLGFDRAPN